MKYPQHLLVLRSRFVRANLVLLLVAGLTLSMLLHPSVARAADYTVSDDASCTAFIAAIGGSEDLGVANICEISSGTLPAGDLVTTNITTNLSNFTNYGTIQANRRIDLSSINNYGTIILRSYSPVYGPINNAGTILVYGELSLVNGPINNTGTIRVLCGGSISGTITGNPAEYEDCSTPTSTDTPTNTPTSTPTFTPTPTPTITNTPLPGCVPSAGKPSKCTATPAPTKTPKR